MESIRGKILVATPKLNDPNFNKSVLVVVEHTREGALGVMLNRPSQFPVRRIISSWHRFVADPKVVFVGGPINLSSLIGLASVAEDDENIDISSDSWKPLTGRIGTVNLAVKPTSVEKLAEVRIFAGYAAWEPGQLEAEITADSWFVLNLANSDPFTTCPDELWWQVFARQEDTQLRQLRLYPKNLASN